MTQWMLKQVPESIKEFIAFSWQISDISRVKFMSPTAFFCLEMCYQSSVRAIVVDLS